VVIPCRNGSATVGGAVASALAQTSPPEEVIVVDDASEDGSAGVARGAGARVTENSTRRNAGGARNAGLEEATGDLVAFLDADAVAPRDWLARARRWFESDDRIVGVGGRVVDDRRTRYGDLDLFLNHSEWIAGGRPSAKKNIPTMAIVYRRAAIGPVRFPESNRGEDTAFAAAVLARGGILWHDPAIVVTHLHERLDARAFRDKQLAVGRTIYETRVALDRPGRVFIRHPWLLWLMPHLWVVLARMFRSGHAGRVFTLFPWLALGEVYRIDGFFLARRQA
jgi:glycosyltransferase involved in cell wall biosynthesis